ncbi:MULTISPECIES: trypsin-like serine protease [Streptomyces]|uniref:trypsin-like serine protease n=1 Tax=Streptomyces TaxID=1883 RepID=UPI00167B0DF8|nr:MULTISPECIES: trypsin-like serine protease [Streptomyces]MBD3575285.1 trypsin-like serine protease [Streptomyces sp. KD18]GGS92061.1 hypothetical protein GCM10010286_15990 [Streptomyces toxytricini]
MLALRPRSARITGLLAATAVSSLALVTTTPAMAVTGPETPADAHPYAVQLHLGDDASARACTGTLVDRFWIMTAASCFATTPGSPVSSGKPVLKASAALGNGKAVDLIEIVVRAERDAALLRLAKPVVDLKTAKVAASAPAPGPDLTAVGFGRTKTQWVPGKPHTGTFTVKSTDATTLALAGKGTDALCKGDTGGPLVNAAGELVGVNSRSGQGGCLGTPATETRTEAVSTRVDGLGEWVQQVRLTTASVQNANSQRCLFVGWRTPENNAPALQADCDPQFADQLWKFEPVAGGGYQVRNAYNNRCLLVSWRTPEEGAPVTQYDCHPNYSDQVWKLEPVDGGGYQIRNALSNRCMYVSWRTPEVGAPVVQVDCDPRYADQVWKV